jgi:hypothetical protein
LRNGVQGTRIYLGKVADGIIVRNHSVLTHTGVLFPKRPATEAMKVMSSIHDTSVLDEYHHILIPKAIEYSAGILDYFFRGRLAVAACKSSTPGKIHVRVTNQSGTNLRGGGLGLFADDSYGVRSGVTPLQPAWQQNSELQDGACWEFDFTPPPSYTPTNYVLVYKGTIGADANHQALDPVDAGIAIASANFQPEWQFLMWENTTLVPDWNNVNNGNPVAPESKSTVWTDPYGFSPVGGMDNWPHPELACPTGDGRDTKYHNCYHRLDGPVVKAFPHPVAQSQVLDLERQWVNVLSVKRHAADGSVLFTGVEGTDYTVNRPAGTVTITSSGLATTQAGQQVRVTYSPYADISNCQKSGFKNVQAKAIWHGRFGYLSHDPGGRPTHKSCELSGCPCENWETSQPNPDQSKYLSVALNCTMAKEDTHYDEQAGHMTTVHTDAQTQRVLTVHRRSGIVTLTEAVDSGDPQALLADATSEASRHVGIDAWVGSWWFDGAVSQHTLNCPPWTYTLTENGVAQHYQLFDEYSRLVADLAVDVESGTFTHQVWSETPHSHDTPKALEQTWNETLTFSATNFAHTIIQHGHWTDRESPDGAADVAVSTYTWGRLSSPYTAADVQTELATLLKEWDLTDDVTYPWRAFADEYCTIAPLVSRDDAGTISPEAYGYVELDFVDDNTLYYTGGIRGKPLPHGFERHFDFRHVNDYAGPGYRYGAWSPNFLALATTQWTEDLKANSFPRGAWVIQEPLIQAPGDAAVYAQKWVETLTNPGGTYSVSAWLTDLRSQGELCRLHDQFASCNGCPGVEDFTCPLDPAYSGGCTNFTLPYSSCNPSVMAITPSGEAWGIGRSHPLPSVTLDQRYGTRWQAQIQQGACPSPLPAPPANGCQ